MSDAALHIYHLEVSYTESKLIDYALKKHQGVIRSTSFTNTLRYEVAIPSTSIELFLYEMARYGKHRVRVEPKGVEWATK